jgi:hypothetical protein
MSDNIGLHLDSSGDDGVNRITSAIDRLHESLIRLGENSAVGRLAQQMELMQATMVTGFAGLASTMEKMAGDLATRQARAIEEGGDKVAAALDASGMKAQMARERQMDRQISADNAFNHARLGMIEGARERELELENLFERTRDDVAKKGLASRILDYDREEQIALAWEQSLQKSRDRELAGEALFNRVQAELLQQRQSAQILDLAREEELALRWEQSLEKVREAELAGEALFNRAQAEMQQQRQSAQILDYAREEELAARWEASLQQSREKELAGESLFNRVQSELQQQRVAAQILDYAREEQLAHEWEAALQRAREKVLADEALFDRTRAEMANRALAERQAAAERDARLNVSYRMASPTTQAQIQARAVVAADEGLDPAKLVGTKAAADAAGKSLAELHAIIESGRAATRGAAADNKTLATSFFELDGALRQAEGAFRGAAHQAGIYGFHHGQLIALLAGGAVAAGLHHIAETGAEVEYQLASLNALSGETEKIDLNKFIGISAGTLTGLKDAAEGMHALAQAGQGQQAAFAALPDVMRLATLGEMSVAQASEMAVESMHAFGKEITDLGDIGDILVAVGAKSNLSVHKLAEDMKSAAVTGALFNLDMKEITATVGVLAERGLTIQPLSSALNKLYEPSAKTAKVMKEWHLDVKDGEGNLKNYSQFMGELAAKVNEFRVPADALKQLGMSTQSIKAMEVMTQHLGDYKHLLHEAEDAHGKMFSAMIEKEDTAEGSWKRLGSTVDGAFVSAFKEAEPVVRSVEESLMNFAASPETINALGNIAAGIARLTETALENIGTMLKMAAAYGAMRILTSLTTMLNEYMVAKRAAMALSVQNTVVVQAEAVQLELFAVAENSAAAGAGRLAVATEVAATGMRMLTASMGWIMIAIVAATTAVELLSGKLDENEKKKREQQNTYNTTTDAIQREIDRLKELEKQLDLTGETGTKSAAKVQLAFAKLKEDQAKSNLEAVEASSVPDTSLRRAGRRAPGSMDGEQIHAADIAAAKKAYDDAHAAAAKASNMLAELESVQDAVKGKTALSDLKKKVEGLQEATAFTNTPAAKAAVEQVNEHVRALKGQQLTLENVTEMTERYHQVEKEIAATKRTVTALPDDKDAARVRIEQLQEELRLAQMLSKVAIDGAKSQNKRGELGDLQLVNRERDESIKLHQKALDIAIAERDAAGPLKGAQQEKYESRIKSARMQLAVDDANAERQKLDALDKMAGAELQARAKALESKGQLEAAYLMTWEAKNRDTLDRLSYDIADAENAQYRDRLQRYKAFLEEQRALGANDARFKEGKEAFDAAQATLRQRVQDARSQNGPGSGLYSTLNSSIEERDAYGDMLPKLREAYAQVAPTSSIMRGGDKSKIKEAQNELREIQQQMEAMRNTGVSMAESIGRALKEAFGHGGEAMGGVLVAAANYSAKLEEIDTRLKVSKGTEADKAQAAAATASAQIKGYGDMAGAAKGFFDQNSNGYRILHTTEQAFRVFEIAQAAMALGKKLVFKQTEVAATTALNGEKVAGEAAASGASTALAAGEASAWGVTAVAKAIASLPFPLNLAAGAATAAAIVGLGIKLTGGFGGGSNAAQRQADQGTGTIAGDPKAKTESLARSLALVEQNTYNDMVVSMDMLRTLQSINSNISNFAGQLLQNSDIANPDVRLSSGIGKTGWAQADMAATGAEIGLAVAGPVGAAVGAALGYITSKIPAIQKLYSSIFGGKQSLDDTGFMLGATTLGDVASRGVNAQTYADVTTSGGWFRSDKHNTQTTGAGDDANRAIAQILLGIGDTIKAAGGALGLSGDAFEAKLSGFVVDIGKISLKGLSSSEQQAAIQSAFSKVGDQMAKSALSTITQFSKAGEGALETLVRVANDYQTIDAVLGSFGQTFRAVGVESIAAREHLIDLAGGLDKFTSSGSSFTKDFLTKAQQQAPVLAAVTKQLGAMNLGWVQTREQFAGVIQGLDLTNAADQETYTSLMRLQAAFAATHAAIDDTSKSAQEVADERRDLQGQLDEMTLTSTDLLAKQRDAIDESNRALFDQIQALKAQADAASKVSGNVDAAFSVLRNVVNREKTAVQATVDTRTTSVSRLQGLSDSLHSALDSYKSTEQTTAARAAARSEIQANLAITKAGGKLSDDQIASLKKALTAVTQKEESPQFASYLDYLKDMYETQNDIAGLAGVTDDSLSVEKAALQAAKDQLKAFDDLLLKQQDLIDEAKGQSTSLLSIDNAVAALALALNAARSNPTLAAGSAINNAYQSALGRAPDADGLAYWQHAAASGTSVSSIVDSIKNSTEAKLNQLYQSVLGRAPDAAGLAYWAKAFGATMDDSETAAWMKSAQTELANNKGLPAFALGGSFGGGMALVGENGPEIVELPQSRIYNARQSAEMMSGTWTGATPGNDEMARQMRALVEEIRQLRAAIAAGDVAQIKELQKVTDALDRVMYGGDSIQTRPAS